MSIIVQIILAILIAMFLVHVAIELRATRKSTGKGEKTSVPAPVAVDSTSLPVVSVLLPLYNEKLVVEKLIGAVCAIKYPPEKLEILVLDDSTDETGQLVGMAIERQKARGINIAHLRREKRIGFKAGNLNYGLQTAKGEFIAIFDADFLPPQDFLQKIMPYFNDEKVGFLQTGIEYVNASHTFLTHFQAMEAGHKEDVTSGFAREGYMASLTGSSCVWRKKCIDSIGGISQATITEDVDMGYTAQLKNWTYVYPRDVVSQAELPETMAAFRVQRQRWARGLAHNAFLHARDLFTTDMSLIAKIHAITLVFSPLLLALFYLLLLICPLIALSTPKLGLFFQIACWIFFVAAIVWGWSNTSEDSGETKNKPSLWLRIWYVVAYILIFLPLSLYYFIAIIQTAFWGKGNFHSTPKGYGRERIPHPAINTFLLGMEIFSFLFALFTLILAIYEKNYWVCLYSLIALGGFGMTLFFSFSDSRKKFLATGHILITGASGSLGNALALEYAAPGIHLTLQGRKRENLEDLAARCEEKGATTAINVLDLADTEATRQWARELAENDPPNLVIANAGLNTNIGADGKGEPFAESKALVNVNLLSTMALFDGILPAFRQRGSGQFAIVSSLASYYGLVTTPTYCATKAALRTWGTSLRGWLRSEGIHINVILPGYVSSPMCDGMPGPKPFLWEPARAAKVIRKRLEWDWARISFPFPLNLGIWSLSILPAFIAMPIARILGYGR